MPHTVSDVLVVLKPDARPLARRAGGPRCGKRWRRCPRCRCCSRRRSGCGSTRAWAARPADLSVRVFGPDLDELARLGDRARDLMSGDRGDRGPEGRAGGRPAAAADRRRPGGGGARRPHAGRDRPRRAHRAWWARSSRRCGSGSAASTCVLRAQDDRRRDAAAIRTLLLDGHDGDQDPAGPGGERSRRPSAPPPCGARRAAAGSRSRPACPAATWAARPKRSRARLEKDLKLPTGYFFDVGGRVGEPGARDTRAARLRRRGHAGRVRAAVPGARLGGRGGGHPGHSSRRVRRRHPRPADLGRDLERLVAGRAHRAVRDRRPERPRAGGADPWPGRGRQALRARRWRRPASAASAPS